MFPLLLALSAPAADPVSAPQPTVQSDCAKISHYFPSGNCPGHGLYPFQMQPRVCPVAVCPCDGANNNTGTPACQPWVKEFSSAAHIAFPRFDVDGTCIPGDGLVIYEGMRLTVDPNTGKYDLTFTATVPHMPVNLRLQLQFIKGNEVYRLTLPPIRLEPNREAKPGDPTPWTFNVAHRGYSALFQDTIQRPNVYTTGSTAAPTKITPDWKLERTGTARFGTPIAIEDPSR